MNRPHLPFQVLGQIGPILAWTEGDAGSRLPETWTTDAVPFKQRERSWLIRELPTYSYDNVKDIITGTRAEHKGPRPAGLPRLGEARRARLSPPPDYDLLQAFRQLNQYLFVWNGTELCVREGRMEELHELAIRLPASHVVRHGHARAVAEGVVSFEEALDMPELVTVLPSNSFGLRSIVRKGLSESHLHLNGVTSAEETWADNLLKPLSGRRLQGRTPEERRLMVLNLFAGRLLALSVWRSLLAPDAELPLAPQDLLWLLDQIYFARSLREEQVATEALEEAMQRMLGSLEEDAKPQNEARPRLKALVRHLPEEYEFLLRWVAPTAMRLDRRVNRGDWLPGSIPEGPRDRYRFVHQLHLAAHLRLVQLTRRATEEDQDEDQRRRKRRGPEASEPGSGESPDPRRSFLHEALFRYLVCRTHHWQLTTQQDRTTGLTHFKTFFDTKERRPSGLTDLQHANLVFDQLRQWRGLRVLEGRVSPPKRPQELVPWILAYARPDDRRFKKFGMVVHFKKEWDHKEEHRLPDAIRSPVPRLRWGKRRRNIRDEGMRLYRLLQRPTPVTPFVVGIDACNLELATPPEVFAPVFRFLRELPIPLRDGSQPYTPYYGLLPVIRRLVEQRRLGMTYHVGEDFRHLLSGLRAIDEVVHFLEPQPGDRLGHGTALALNPQDWLEHNGYQAVVPRLEWLDTLVWVHHFLGPGDDIVGELAIEDRIQRHSWEIYSTALGGEYNPWGIAHHGDEQRSSRDRPNRQRGLLDWDWSPLTLWDAWTLRQLDPYSLDLQALLKGELVLRPLRGFCIEDRRWHTIQKRILRQVKKHVGSRNAYLLLALYWLSTKVRKEGDEVLVVDMKGQKDAWFELCRRVEDKMKTEIHERELVIEVNPSSNRIIGPMERYGQHHVFSLTLDENRRLDRQVRVSVNTDNPAVCNTTLAHEHYLLGEQLIGEGVPEAEVVKWLEWLRSNGEEYNFVRRLKTPEEDPDMERLMSWLRSIRPTVREAERREEKHEAFWRWLRIANLRSRGFTREALAGLDLPTLERLAGLERRLDDLDAQFLGRETIQQLISSR